MSSSSAAPSSSTSSSTSQSTSTSLSSSSSLTATPTSVSESDSVTSPSITTGSSSSTDQSDGPSSTRTTTSVTTTTSTTTTTTTTTSSSSTTTSSTSSEDESVTENSVEPTTTITTDGTSPSQSTSSTSSRSSTRPAITTSSDTDNPTTSTSSSQSSAPPRPTASSPSNPPPPPTSTRFTTIITRTQSNSVATRTEVVTQSPGPDPELIPNNSSGRDGASQFFSNKGAVAGVFVLVGISALSIILFLLFWMRKRRRAKERDAEITLAASLTAAGLSRSPIDGDDHDGRGGASPDLMSQYRPRRSSSGDGHDPFADRPSSYSYAPPGNYLQAGLDGLQPLALPGSDHERPWQNLSQPPELTNQAASRHTSFGPVTPASRLSTSQGPPLPVDAHRFGTTIPSPPSKYSPSLGDFERHQQFTEFQDYFGSGQPDARLNPYLLAHNANNSGVSLGDHQDYSRPVAARKLQSLMH